MLLKLIKYDWSSISLYIGTKYEIDQESGSIAIPYSYKDEELFAFLKAVKFSALKRHALEFYKDEPKQIKREYSPSVHYALPIGPHK
jgi:hypothetical protein